MTTVTPTQLHERRQRGETVYLVDVRTPAEFRACHAEYARNVPLDSLDPQALLQSRNGATETPIYVICQGGGRSTKACQALIAGGVERVVNVEGGTNAWEAAGLPVVRGKATISLERQVRIAAGFLVLVGAVLGWLVHPAFYGLSAFVGAGLVFAGVTDTCGMGMMLARMPWNQAGSDAAPVNVTHTCCKG